MKIKMKISKVIHGAVWLAGVTLDLPDDQARQLIQDGEAEPIGAPKPAEAAPEKEKGKK